MKNKFMKIALQEAELGFLKNEVPIGVVIEREGEILAKIHNQTEIEKNPCMHAEIIAIKLACEKIGEKYLIGCNLYSTLEPCCMCSGAISLAKIENLYIGAKDEKFGAVISGLEVFKNGNFNHKPNVYDGILEIECGEILKRFFKNKR